MLKVISIFLILIGTQVLADDNSLKVTEDTSGPEKAAAAAGEAYTAYGRGQYQKALNLWKSLAETNNAWAQLYLGVLYSDYKVPFRDNLEAFKWYNLAAENGLSGAQSNVGSIYWKGNDTITKNLPRAIKWFELASKNTSNIDHERTTGDQRAQHNLGMIYFAGEGVLQDYNKALNLFKRAAKGNLPHNTLSQYALGVMYYNGFGTLQDKVLAHMWWDISAAQQNKKAPLARNKVAKEMTPRELSIAKAMAKECMPKRWPISRRYRKCDYQK